MGLNTLGERKLRRMRRETGLHNIVSGFVRSHDLRGDVWWEFIEAGSWQTHRHGFFNPDTRQVAIDSDPVHVWPTCELIDPHYEEEERMQALKVKFIERWGS